MKSQVLHTVGCYISSEAAGEIWHWSLFGVGSERVKVLRGAVGSWKRIVRIYGATETSLDERFFLFLTEIRTPSKLCNRDFGVDPKSGFPPLTHLDYGSVVRYTSDLIDVQVKRFVQFARGRQRGCPGPLHPQALRQCGLGFRDRGVASGGEDGGARAPRLGPGTEVGNRLDRLVCEASRWSEDAAYGVRWSSKHTR